MSVAMSTAMRTGAGGVVLLTAVIGLVSIAPWGRKQETRILQPSGRVERLEKEVEMLTRELERAQQEEKARIETCQEEVRSLQTKFGADRFLSKADRDFVAQEHSRDLHRTLLRRTQSQAAKAAYSCSRTPLVIDEAEIRQSATPERRKRYERHCSSGHHSYCELYNAPAGREHYSLLWWLGDHFAKLGGALLVEVGSRTGESSFALGADLRNIKGGQRNKQKKGRIALTGE
eukprot:Hpha_TRINITY_DN5825_c0_g1::TRINITY_DN5825_c0_g1_i1::g.45564::m.45564